MLSWGLQITWEAVEHGCILTYVIALIHVHQHEQHEQHEQHDQHEQHTVLLARTQSYKKSLHTCSTQQLPLTAWIDGATINQPNIHTCST